MESPQSPLAKLREDIDRIDRAVVDLLIERTDVVRAIADVKSDRGDGRLAMRPAREAQILRSLVARAGDRFPRAVLVRMWRELLAATTRQQTPVTIAVYAPRDEPAVWDLARDHFGSTTPLIRSDSSSQAIRALSAGSATIAVLPLPHDDETWWLGLIASQPDRLRVFARLPFVSGRPEQREEPGALALGRLEPEPSGDDLTLLAIETRSGISRDRLRRLIETTRLTPQWQATSRTGDGSQLVHLVEVDDLVLDSDPRLAAVHAAADGDVLRIVALGGYPRALTAG